MSEENGKSRALRIRLDYHKHLGPLYWSRWTCAIVALVATGLYGAYVMIGVFATSPDPATGPGWFGRASLQINTGPLAQVHAHFESDCQQCHGSSLMQPIAADALQIDQTTESNSPDSVLAAKCQVCHSVQSHLGQTTDDSCRQIDQNCAVCHRDHGGRHIDLDLIASSQCTQCHANLTEACDGQLTAEINSEIADFSEASHATPAKTFRSLERDSGRILFSHAQHMNLGQVKSGRRGGFRSDMLSDRWQDRYQTGDNGLVQLVCSDCHKLQAPSGQYALADLSGAESATEMELSHFYAPIDFEQHCEACHQMTFAGQTPDMLPLPHAATRAEFERVLSARLVGGTISGSIAMPMQQALDQEPSANQIQQLVEAQLDAAVEQVYAGCVKCHMAADIQEPSLRALSPPSTTSAMLPQRWLTRGLFNHGTHEKITNCAFCHQPSENEDSSVHSEVMIKGPESCVPCHRDGSRPLPQSSLTGGPLPDLRLAKNREEFLGNANQPGVASVECTLCHRYHWHRPIAKSPGASVADAGAPP